MINPLVKKYNIPGPRYTSYPPVPFWNTEAFEARDWSEHLSGLGRRPEPTALSLYLHLPFCESLCVYCACNKHITRNHDHERKYMLYLMKEWELIRRRTGDNLRFQELHLGGGTPTFFSPENLEQLVGFLRGEFPGDPLPEMSAELHPGYMEMGHLKVFRDLGFRRLSMGVQDFDEKVSKLIHRHQSFEKVRYWTDKVRELGFASLNYDLVYGLPGQTVDSLNQTLDRVAELRPDRMAFYGYAHVPAKFKYQQHLTPHLPSPEIRLEMQWIVREQLLAEGYMEIGMDHFALPGDDLSVAAQENRLHRNFMGYTTRQSDVLLGLGMSAISDLGEAYAQNAPGLQAYYNMLDQGHLPVVKGHLMRFCEQQMRTSLKHILCHFEGRKVKWNRHLEALLRDGLIEKKGTRLFVTAKGKPFVRVICMAMDPLMQGKTEALLSKAV